MDHWTDLDWAYAWLFGTHPDWGRIDWAWALETWT